MRYLISSILFFFLPFFLLSQAGTLADDEKVLNELLISLRASKNDLEKKERNLAFKTKLEKVLQKDGAISYPFSSLTTVGFINSPDKLMRIVNYNIEQDDQSQHYTCFIVHYDKRRKKQYVNELIDNSFGMPTKPTETLSSDEWYGALYFKVIPVKKGSKTIYTVLGWDYYGPSSQLKLIDAIYFTGSSVKLGSPIFKEGKKTLRRVYFEHSKKTSMALNYEENRERIVLDHLSPEAPSLKGYRSYYVPDMSYDAYVLESGKWVLHEDVISTNKGSDSKKQTIYVKNQKTGVVEKKEIKSKWINPEDNNSPTGGFEHVAVTPESEAEVKNQKDKDKVKSGKKDKRDPSQVSFYDDVIKKKKKKGKRKR